MRHDPKIEVRGICITHPNPHKFASTQTPRTTFCARVLLQSGSVGARKLIKTRTPNPWLWSHALAKALPTITTSGFGHQKANTRP